MISNRRLPQTNRKRSTAEECLSHPWLSGHAAPPPPPPRLPLASLDETSQSESEPESPVPPPELLVLPPFSMGDLKSGRGTTFTFSEPFPSRSEIQQEVICWAAAGGATANQQRARQPIGFLRDELWLICARVVSCASLAVLVRGLCILRLLGLCSAACQPLSECDVA